METTRPLLAIFVIGWLVTSLCAVSVEIPDPGLVAAIRQELNKPDGPITVADMESLTELHASNRDIESIAGLEAARYLTRLELDHNRLTRLELPKELVNLDGLIGST